MRHDRTKAGSLAQHIIRQEVRLEGERSPKDESKE
jgi:hypothetical protein